MDSYYIIISESIPSRRLALYRDIKIETSFLNLGQGLSECVKCVNRYYDWSRMNECYIKCDSNSGVANVAG